MCTAALPLRVQDAAAFMEDLNAGLAPAVPPFNQVTLNWYATGNEFLPYHVDWLCGSPPGAVVSSVTLAPPGVPARDFVLKPTVEERPSALADRFVIPTRNGTVITLGGTALTAYRHSVPPAPGHQAPRINASFRAFAATSP